jgi:hypothetical protein
VIVAAVAWSGERGMCRQVGVGMVLSEKIAQARKELEEEAKKLEGEISRVEAVQISQDLDSGDILPARSVAPERIEYYDRISVNRLGQNGTARSVLLQAQKIDLRGQSPREYSDPREGRLTPYMDPPPLRRCHPALVRAWRQNLPRRKLRPG